MGLTRPSSIFFGRADAPEEAEPALRSGARARLRLQTDCAPGPPGCVRPSRVEECLRQERTMGAISGGRAQARGPAPRTRLWASG